MKYPTQTPRYAWWLVGAAIFLLLIGVVWVAGRLTGALGFYTVVVGSMEPHLNPGDRFFSSNLHEPKRGDAVCFHRRDSLFGSAMWVERLYGMPGDTILFRSGRLFVNGREPAPDKRFKHQYTISSSALPIVRSRYGLGENEGYNVSDSENIVYLQPHQADDPDIAGRRFVLSPAAEDEYITAAWNKPWNADHFGPVVVPPGHWFLVGDNRRNALDSRYIGFVPQSSYVGTVLADPVR